jgi:class 3 adenylate cyclase
MFCDVDESTSARSGATGASVEGLVAIVGRRNGRVLRRAGPRLMAAFTSATDALGAAVEMQRNGPPMPAGSGLRIGIAAGDVTYEDGDCFGPPVVVAARLEAAGEGGQIVVDQVVRWLAGDRSGA